MAKLPGRTPNQTAGQPGPTLTDAMVDAAVDKAIAESRHEGTSPRAVIGSTPPVPQPDSRIVPAWATGIAVASIGVGAGSTGLGCAAWLLFKGLSLVSVPSLERFAWIIVAPFAGAAMLATAVGSVISQAKKAAPPVIHNYNNGPVYQDHSTHRSKTFGIKAETYHNPKEKK